MTRADRAPVFSSMSEDLVPTFLDEATCPDLDTSSFGLTEENDVDSVFRNVAHSEPATLELWVDADPSSSWSSPCARRRR